MKILHYALGFPPYRSGGLTKFCVDLMTQQSKEGHAVAMLWPGQMKFISKKVNIKVHKAERIKEQTIQSFEVINPLPISFDEGIMDIEAFTKEVESKVYEKFLEEIRVDVIHIHTLMGLHKSFLDVAKDKKIRLVFTAHDFFPICPKVTMFRHGAICSSVKSCEECGVCNATALGMNKMRILQSPLYRELKDSFIVKKLRKGHRDRYLSDIDFGDLVKISRTASEYKKLREYYASLLECMDMVHYNSSVTKKVYEAFFEIPYNRVVSITHSDIKDKRRKKDYTDNKLHIRYLGPQGGQRVFSAQGGA